MGFFGRTSSKDWIEARARVLDIDGMGSRPADDGAIQMHVELLHLLVHPPGGTPYELKLTGRDARKVGAQSFGHHADVPIKIDPNDPNNVVVDEERAEAQQEAELKLLDEL